MSEVKHEYTCYVSFGITVELDEEVDLDTEAGFTKVKNAVVEEIRARGLEEVIDSSDFGDIDYDCIEE